MNREQKPRNADLSGDVVAGAPVSDGSDATPATKDQADTNHAGTNQIGKHETPKDETPPWAAPLRDMYQQVVDEPLPDFLSDLLSRLDRDDE